MWQPGSRDRVVIIVLRDRCPKYPATAYTLYAKPRRMSQSHRQHELEKRLAESWPVREWCDSHVLLGVSGGPDSVAMLRGMVSLKETHGGAGKLYVAHLNHQMRGTAADEDEAWVRILCERFGVQLAVERTDIAVIAADQGDGWEAAARSARYDFLRRTAERLG